MLIIFCLFSFDKSYEDISEVDNVAQHMVMNSLQPYNRVKNRLQSAKTTNAAYGYDKGMLGASHSAGYGSSIFQDKQIDQQSQKSGQSNLHTEMNFL